MEPLVGVTNATTFRKGSKSTFLLCDQVALIDLGYGARSTLINEYDDREDWRLSELDWLIDEGLVTPAFHPSLHGGVHWEWEFKNVVRALPDPEVREMAKLLSQTYRTAEILPGSDTRLEHENIKLRLSAAMMRQLEDRNAFALLPSATWRSEIEKLTSSKKAIVLSVVLKNFPRLVDDTPWQQVLDFKSDPDSSEKLGALRNWITELARKDYSRAEVEEMMEFYLNDYENHMKLHKLKFSHGSIESIVLTTLDVVENLVKLKWSSVAQALFKIARHDMVMLEAELNAPGRQVAYIRKVQERFKTVRGE